MDNRRLQSQEDASYTLVSPSLCFLKGGSQVEEFARWSVLRSSLRSGSMVVPKDVRETQSLNEVWLKVQGRFNKDHQDFGRAIGEAFKLVWIKRPQLSVEGVQEKIEVKSKY